MLALPQIRAEVERLASKIGATCYILPTYGYSEDGARPHIEVDGQGYHYVVVERGQELKRVTTADLDELLYHVFQAVSFELVYDYELNHRVYRRDFRRLLFQRQVELLSGLSEQWGERRATEHRKILEAHPFANND